MLHYLIASALNIGHNTALGTLFSKVLRLLLLMMVVAVGVSHTWPMVFLHSASVIRFSFRGNVQANSRSLQQSRRERMREQQTVVDSGGDCSASSTGESGRSCGRIQYRQHRNCALKFLSFFCCSTAGSSFLSLGRETHIWRTLVSVVHIVCHVVSSGALSSDVRS